MATGTEAQIVSQHQELVLISAGGKTASSSELVSMLSRLSGTLPQGTGTLPQGIIVVEGSLGVGKTSLLKKIGEDLDSFLIDLGDSKFQDSEEELRKCIKAGRSSKPHGVLFLFDALQQFLVRCKWSLKAFFSIIKREVLIYSPVLMATCPAGVDYLCKNFEVKHFYSIEGFSPTSTRNFFKLETEPEEFRLICTLLNQHQKILKNLCKNPFICCKLIEILKAKKIHALKLTITNILHEIVLVIINQELCKEGNAGISSTFNLYSLSPEHSKSFSILCSLAFLDLVNGSMLDSLNSYSIFLSSFSLDNSIASLEEVSSLGLIEHCDSESYYANIKKRLFWFLAPVIRDFLAAFYLHQLPPLDQLCFLSEHAQSLIQSDRYHGWLEFFYGLIVLRDAESNPTRMMMTTLNELIVYCLDLEDSNQLMIFIKCLWETGEPSHWKKIASKPHSFFNMSFSEEDVEQIKPGLVDMITYSGFNDWVIELESKDSEVGINLIAYIAAVNIEDREDKALEGAVKIWPKGLKSVSQLPEQPSDTSTTTEKKILKIGQFYCRAIREILQRVLQLYSTLKLKGDCSNMSFISFLNCECFRKAVEGRVTFEPVVPSHFLSIENASRKVGRRGGDLVQHFREFHDDKAVELVILLRPCLKTVKFLLPSTDEPLEIKLSGKYMPDTTYEIFVSSFISDLEEIVQCCAAQERVPAKTEKVVPGMPKFIVSPLSPAISLPPTTQKSSTEMKEHTHSQGEGSRNTDSSASTVGPLNQPRPSVIGSSYQASSEKGPSQRVSLMQSKPSSLHFSMTYPIQQQSRRALANLKAGTILYSVDPSLPRDCIVDLPKEDVLLQSGGNGQIFAGNFEGLRVAVKKTSYRSKEYSIITQLKHENIISLLAFIWGEENPAHRRRYFCYHVMPQMSGDLARLVTDKKDFMLRNLYATHRDNTPVMDSISANTRHILSSVLRGLSYLHSLHIAHRDVKASNVLLKFHCHCDNPLFCSCDTKYRVVLCDYDAAVQLDSSDRLPPTSLQTSQAIAPQYHCIPVGTNGYRAPECSMHVTANLPDAFSPPISTRCDVFSFGILCLRLMVGEEGPFRQRSLAMLLLHYYQTGRVVEGKWKGKQQRVSIVVVEDILKLSKLRREMSWMHCALELVECCLKVNPLDRLTADQLLSHSFFFTTMSSLLPVSPSLVLVN